MSRSKKIFVLISVIVVIILSIIVILIYKNEKIDNIAVGANNKNQAQANIQSENVINNESAKIENIELNNIIEENTLVQNQVIEETKDNEITDTANETNDSNINQETKEKTSLNNSSDQTKAQNNKNTQSIQKNTSTTNNNNIQANPTIQTQTNTESNTNNNQPEQINTAYWCVEGGTHHLAGDGANEHGYYNSWDAANQAFKEYTKDWDSCQYKIDVCACGKYYFWAVK